MDIWVKSVKKGSIKCSICRQILTKGAEYLVIEDENKEKMFVCCPENITNEEWKKWGYIDKGVS